MKNGRIVTSAPGKIHLLGEHTVVYGKPALLSTINKRLSVTITASDNSNRFTINDENKNIFELQRIIENSIKENFYEKIIPPYAAVVTSQIPIGYGLGSSAALCAAFTAGLLTFLKIKWNKKIVFEIAYEGEKFFHGNPSGGDLATVIEGGLLYFRKEFEFLKSFSPLPFTSQLKNFFIINSGRPVESTRLMIEKVAKNKNSRTFDLLLRTQETLTKELVLALKNDDEMKMINIIKNGSSNLTKLGVVSLKSQKIIKEIERMGGAAKISGAGGYINGSGMLLAYHVNPSILLEFAKKKKLEIEKIEIESQGVRIDE